ncbi:hypothetical protein D3C72_1630830 [compost metagenome]
MAGAEDDGALSIAHASHHVGGLPEPVQAVVRVDGVRPLGEAEIGRLLGVGADPIEHLLLGQPAGFDLGGHAVDAQGVEGLQREQLVDRHQVGLAGVGQLVAADAQLHQPVDQAAARGGRDQPARGEMFQGDTSDSRDDGTDLSAASAGSIVIGPGRAAGAGIRSASWS